MRIVGIVVTAAASMLSTPTWAVQKHNDPSYPARVLIIRHAEKPPDSDRSIDLSREGLARAKALSQLFITSAGRPNPFPRPDFIFATAETRHSRRPVETAAPLGAALRLGVDTRFSDDDTRALAKELLGHKRYAGKTVLIVWHQGTIPDLAKALGAQDAPRTWKDSIFDRVWEISYSNKGKVSFKDRPEQLMPGDAAR